MTLHYRAKSLRSRSLLPKNFQTSIPLLRLLPSLPSCPTHLFALAAWLEMCTHIPRARVLLLGEGLLLHLCPSFILETSKQIMCITYSTFTLETKQLTAVESVFVKGGPGFYLLTYLLCQELNPGPSTC